MFNDEIFDILFRLVPFGVYVVDVQKLEVVYANDFYKNMNKTPGAKCWEEVYQDHRKCIFCKIGDLTNSEGKPTGEIVVYEHFNPSDDKWYQIQEQCVFWYDGRVVKVSISVDISKIKEMQNDLAEAHADLRLAHQELEKVALTDPLTHLFNRGKIDEVLKSELDRAKRYSMPLSIILLDMDHFKSVNDGHGHLAGDALLKTMANIISEHARQSDLVGRWGGEEFVILCPGTDLENAYNCAERIRECIEQTEFDTVGNKTASLGVSCYRDGDTEEELVMRADKALYRAKQAGRNRVECETP